MENIKAILKRKLEDQDCTESESSEIKGFIKECINSPLLLAEPFHLVHQIELLFPIEWSEVYDEMKDTPEIEIEFITAKSEEEQIREIANSIHDELHACIARSRETDGKGIDYDSMMTVLLIHEIAKLKYEINLLKSSK